ncbi:hypothetical protein R3W88_014058 [Solanum pinnatisectum]|uniref:Uncharacterized protein n=1 Tax=Solanum pinnatisectum TaxID=50273 RepID=A0AAV9KQH5_9SOLN|nr:hypothetical protein R3W88_014058 [Solanum pinnatisectum]
MAGNNSYTAYNSYETSWADQWDSNPTYEYKNYDQKSGNNGSSNKFSNTFGKTKSVASSGVKKVKSGASASFNWIKDKCHKSNTQKHG